MRRSVTPMLLIGLLVTMAAHGTGFATDRFDLLEELTSWEAIQSAAGDLSCARVGVVFLMPLSRQHEDP